MAAVWTDMDIHTRDFGATDDCGVKCDNASALKLICQSVHCVMSEG